LPPSHRSREYSSRRDPVVDEGNGELRRRPKGQGRKLKKKTSSPGKKPGRLENLDRFEARLLRKVEAYRLGKRQRVDAGVGPIRVLQRKPYRQRLEGSVFAYYEENTFSYRKSGGGEGKRKILVLDKGARSEKGGRLSAEKGRTLSLEENCKTSTKRGNGSSNRKHGLFAQLPSPPRRKKKTAHHPTPRNFGRTPSKPLPSLEKKGTSAVNYPKEKGNPLAKRSRASTKADYLD